MRIFSVILPSRVSGLLFSELALIFCCYLLACFIGVQGSALAYLNDENGWLRLLVVAFSIVAGIFVNNLYTTTRVESRVSLMLRLCNVIGIALIVQGLLAYIPSGLALPRLVMLGGSALTFVALGAWRIFYSAVILRMIGTRNILFVGCDTVLTEIAERIREHPELGFGIAGYIGAEQTHEAIGENVLGRFLGPIEHIEQVVDRVRPDRVIVGMVERGVDLPIPALLGMARRGCLIEEAATAYESVCGRVCSRELRPSQIIFHNELASRPGSVALQSIYTNLLALAAIIVTSPVLILCALAVKLTSSGPALEPDVRVGLHGIPFSLHRFRIHAGRKAASAAGHDSLEKRLTPVGRWLQRLHLVHLPRLFNLLRGEVTFVGPRPERVEFDRELSRYFAYYAQRHSIKPGMTGWSQIHTAGQDSHADSLIRLEYDLYYTKHISLALDA